MSRAKRGSGVIQARAALAVGAVGVTCGVFGCGRANHADGAGQGGNSEGNLAGTSAQGGRSSGAGGAHADPGNPNVGGTSAGVVNPSAGMGAGGRATADAGSAGNAATLETCLDADIDVPVVELSGSALIDGAVSSSTDFGYVGLRSRDPGTDDLRVIELASTAVGSYSSLRVIAGTYDVAYWPGTVGAKAPSNYYAAFMRGVSLAPGKMKLDLNVPVVPLTGAAMPSGVQLNAKTKLGLQRRGDEYTFQAIAAQSFHLQVLPGVYDFSYWDENPSAINYPKTLLAGSLNVASPAATIDAGTPTVEVRGTLSGPGRVDLGFPDGGFMILGQGTPTYSAFVVPGTYDVYYQQISLDPPAPANIRARIRSNVVIPASGPTVLNVDVTTGLVSVTVTIENKVPDANRAGDMYLRDVITNEYIALGTVSQGTNSLRVSPGTYDVIYSAGGAPGNKLANVKQGIVVSASGMTQVNVDVPLVNVTGELTIDGSTFSPEPGSVWLRGAAGDEVKLGDLSKRPYGVSIVPGTYDVYYTAGVPQGGSSAPRNSSAKIRSGVVITANMKLDVHVPHAVATGKLTLAGAVAASGSGRLTLRDQEGASTQLAYLANGSYGADLVPGRYDVYFEPEPSDSMNPTNPLAPRNGAFRLGCLQVR